MKIRFKKNPCPYCQKLINTNMLVCKNKEMFCPYCNGKVREKGSLLLMIGYLAWHIFATLFSLYFVMRFVENDLVLLRDGIIFIIGLGLLIITLKLLFDKKSYDKSEIN